MALAALLSGQLNVLFGGSYALAGSWIAGVYWLGVIVSFFMPDTSGEIPQPEGAYSEDGCLPVQVYG